ncbi:MAG: DMT family transporter [Deltaproteobacteria bacterium]|nr:DMT family transporter [Deltaproteobacteria bacterium]
MEKDKRKELTGYALVAASAITFSAKGIFAKLLYRYGIDPVTLLALRFAMSMPLFWAAVLFFPSERVSWKDIFYVGLSGFLGLYLAALADFYGLLYIDASLERVILYAYPAFVIVWTTLFFKEPMTRRKLFSLGLTYLGLALVMKVFQGVERAQMIGAALVLFSAVIYSLSYIFTEVFSRKVSGVKMSAYATTAAAFAFLGTWGAGAGTIPTEAGAWWLLGALAIVSTFIPVLTINLGIKRIGASRAAIASFIGPVSTAVLAWAVLGESLEPVQLAGMILVMAGVLVVSFERKVKPVDE